MGQMARKPRRPASRWRRIYTALTTLALVAGGSALLAPPAQAAPTKGRIYVIQGISGENLDIKVDGKTVMASAKPKSVVGPLTLLAGNHKVTVGSATSDVTVTAGESADVVAHPATSAQDAPEITAFKNDLKPVGRGKVRLAVAHTAAAPPADIKVNGDVLFSNVANSEALTVDVPAATYTVEVVPAATSGAAILGPVDLAIKAGTLTRVFAIGDVSKGTMDAVVHAIPISTTGSGAPSSVQTGDGGQTATQFTSSSSNGWMLGAFAALLVMAGLGMARRHRSQ